MKKILMVCYGAGHVNIVVELYKKLIIEGQYNIVIFALTTAQQRLKEENIPFKTMGDYHKEIGNKKVLKIGNEIIKNEDTSTVGEYESVLYNGYSFLELLTDYGEEKAKEGLRKFGRRVYLPINFMKAVLKIENPNLVLTTNGPRMENAALIAAKIMNITTVNIEDLFGKYTSEDEINIFFETARYKKEIGDYVFVMTELTKQNILKKKIKTKGIYITGNPAFDKILRMEKTMNSRAIKTKFNIPIDKKIITYLIQETVLKEKITEKLEEISNKNKDFYFIFKYHPNQKINKIERKNLMVINSNLEEILFITDLAITEYSTSGLEAVLLDKNLIAFNHPDVPFKDLKLANTIDSIDEIEKAIQVTLEDKEMKLKLKKGRNNFIPKEESSIQIFNKIKEILK